MALSDDTTSTFIGLLNQVQNGDCHRKLLEMHVMALRKAKR